MGERGRQGGRQRGKEVNPAITLSPLSLLGCQSDSHHFSEVFSVPCALRGPGDLLRYNHVQKPITPDQIRRDS